MDSNYDDLLKAFYKLNPKSFSQPPPSVLYSPAQMIASPGSHVSAPTNELSQQAETATVDRGGSQPVAQSEGTSGMPLDSVFETPDSFVSRRNDLANQLATAQSKLDNASKTFKDYVTSKRRELAVFKKKCVEIEDYKGASHYKRELEKLEIVYQRGLELIEKIGKDINVPKVNNTPLNTMASSSMPELPTKSPSIASSGVTNAKPLEVPSPYIPIPVSKDNHRRYLKIEPKGASTAQLFAPIAVNTPKVTVKNAVQDSKLFMAAHAGRFNELKKLIEEEKLDVNSVDFTTGKTALHAVMELGQTFDITKYLVEHGADVNVKDRKGQTPLHLSVERRIDDITNFLVEQGGNIFLKDNTGKSPHSIAGVTPQYQGELTVLARKIESQRGANKQEEIITAQGKTEAVVIHVKGGSHHTILVADNENATKVIGLVAKKLLITDIVNHVELIESILGKERKVAANEPILLAKSKWPNQNSTYCKFVLRIKPGTPENIQNKFREKVYGM